MAELPQSFVARARRLRRDGTAAENRLWYFLRNRQLAGLKFVRQVPPGPYVVDFVCREAALVIELDGGQHAIGGTRDVTRTAYLTAHGYSVLRFWNNDIFANRRGVLEAIVDVVRGSPSPGLRFAPADLSPTGRGTRGAHTASAAFAAQLARSIRPEGHTS